MPQQFHRALDAMPVAAGVHGRDDDRWIHVNPAMAALLGHADARSLVGTVALDIVAPEQREVIRARRAARRWDGPGEAHRTKWLRDDGTPVPVEVTTSLVALGGADLVLVVGRDLVEVEQRERAEEALRRSEAMFRDLYAAAPDGILVVDQDGAIVLANGVAHRIFGYENGALVGTRLENLIPTALRSAHASHRDGYFAAPRTRHTSANMMLVAQRMDGSEMAVDISLGPFSHEGRQAVLAVVRDISERKKLEQSLRRTEEQLRQSQKMEAVGALAGGVAHDFNNVLSVILSYATMIIDGLEPGDPLRDDLQEIRTAAERAGELTRQLLAFSRRQIVQPTVVDLNELLAGMVRMLRRLLGENCELALLTPGHVGKIHADPGQVEQVVMNLAVNARDAMPEGGTVSVETSDVTLDADYAATHADVVPGRYVMMAVTDTGVGMDAATRERIFEPFFTTKEQGKGTGLGLPTVYGIVKQAGGHIWVYSEPGRGTTFKVYFPRTSLTAELARSLPPAAETLRGSETVLLVEDDDQVRGIAMAILRRAGYNVLETSNGGEALLVCEKYTAKIHLLLTDVMMPRMSGRELAERLGPLRPDMKLLYVSGYAENAVIHHGVLDAGIAFLQKPITPDALLRKVREVLDGAQRPASGAR